MAYFKNLGLFPQELIKGQFFSSECKGTEASQAYWVNPLMHIDINILIFLSNP